MKYDYEANKHLLVDSTGRRLTVGLFQELSDNPAAPFSLADWRRVYVECADPTDYAACQRLLGSWDHWQLLLECKGFMEHLQRWRDEVDAKLRSEAIAELKHQSKGAKGTMAAKWLAERGAVPMKRGRPRKEEQPTAEVDRAKKDAERLGLSVVTGGKP